VTGTLDFAAYPLARAFGRSPEQAQAETTSPKDVLGSALGITQDPAYQGEASRRAMTAIGQGVEQYAVKPLAQMSGLPEQDVGSMLGSATIGAGPGIARGAQATAQGAQAVGRGAAQVARAPVDFGRGFVQGVLNPEPTPNSAMVPLQKQAYPAQAGRDFVSGRMTLPELEASRVPSASLFSSPLDQMAMKALPTNAARQPMVPLAGRGMEAIGENLGRGYRTQPLQAAADAGLMSLGVPPIGPAARAVQGLASLRASKAADFTPGFPQQLAAAQSQAALAPNPQLRLPAPGAAAAPGPVNPATMYAGTGGVSADLPTAGRAALDVRYPPMPALTPKEIVQQIAVEKITSPTTDLQARAQAAFGSQYRPPAAEPAPVPAAMPKPMVSAPVESAPVAGPVSPAAIPAPVAKTPAPVAQSTMPPTSTKLLKATEGRKAVQAALDSGEPTTIKYKTSAGTVTEHVNRIAKSKFDSDLELNHTIVRPDSTTMFGTKKSSGVPVKIEMMDLAKNADNPEFIKVFDNSKPKSPVLLSTYDKDGTLTSRSSQKNK
jgi:hypothetical protein